MKKILLATTVLVAGAGFASAEVTFSGEANMGLKYDNGGLGAYASFEKTAVWYEIDVDLNASTETDTGLTLGASMDLDLDINGDTSSMLTDGEVYVSGAFGTLTFGAVDPASDNLNIGLSQPGFDDLTVDDIAEALYDSVDVSHDVLYVYSVSGFTVAVSTAFNAAVDTYSLGLGYEGDNYNVTLGYNSNEIGEDVWTLDGSYTFDAITVGAMYSKAGDDKAYGIEAAYKLDGGITLSAIWAKNELGGFENDGYGIGAAYDLGGGATFAGGIGKAYDDTVAEVGVKFKF